MYGGYSVIYKNEDCQQYKLLPIRRPNIPAPEKRIKETRIPGRSGILIEDEETWEPITIPVEFNFIGKADEWASIYRNAKKWLLTGTGHLTFSDDWNYFYKVLYCKITDTERTSRRIGKFNAEFTCDPYTYMMNGLQEISLGEKIFNCGEVSLPVYKITGNGGCTLTVNGKAMKATVGQNLTINTELMIAYRTDGTLQNGKVTGDYEDLYLLEGENQISITKGFDLKVIPNWRCI